MSRSSSRSRSRCCSQPGASGAQQAAWPCVPHLEGLANADLCCRLALSGGRRGERAEAERSARLINRMHLESASNECRPGGVVGAKQQGQGQPGSHPTLQPAGSVLCCKACFGRAGAGPPALPAALLNHSLPHSPAACAPALSPACLPCAHPSPAEHRVHAAPQPRCPSPQTRTGRGSESRAP